MKGSIRIILGLILAMGAVGGLDNPTNPLTYNLIFATLGLLVMYSGVRAMKN